MPEAATASAPIEIDKRVFSFGPFRFDPADGLLRRTDGAEIVLPPRAAQVLGRLLRSPGEVVSKRELMDAVWEDTSVSESSLTDVVSHLRQALSDDARDPEYIQTLHRRGYRFVATVESPVGAAIGADAVPWGHDPEPPEGAARSGLVAPWIVACLALALAAWGFLRPGFRTPGPSPPGQRPLQLDIALPPGQRLHIDTKSPSLAVSPDGRTAVFVAVPPSESPTSPAGPRKLYRRRLDENVASPIAGAGNAIQPFFSPDGRWLAYFQYGELYRVLLDGGRPVQVGDAGYRRPAGGTWGDDGSIVISDGRGLLRIPAAGGPATALTAPGAEEGSHKAPHFLPGSRAVLFSVAKGASLSDHDVAVLSLETGTWKTLLAASGSYPCYVPTGHLVYARAGELLAVPFDADRLETRGAPMSVLGNVLSGPHAETPQFAVSRSGVLIYASGGLRRWKRQIAWVDMRGEATPLEVERGPWWVARLSPGGRRILLQSDAGVQSDVYVYDLARGVLSRLTNGLVYDGAPVWHPDGRSVTFSSGKSWRENLVTKRVDGNTAPDELLPVGDRSRFPDSWSPDGRFLVFDERNARGDYDLWVVEPGVGQGPRLLLASEFNEQEAEFSPDGRWLAYLGDETGRYEVYLTDYPELEHKVTISAQGGSDVRWSPDGRRLYYRSGRRVVAVDVETEPELSPGPPRTLFETDAVGLDLAPDGSRFLMAVESDEPHVGPRHVHVILDVLPLASAGK